ncbi:unnamed protein product [Protopolystoma xenopodis]|uniref:Uncharacterized protein n=1 Tax=Protopolystoma xenopodis TaxID=117903 RepID=A0A3S5BYA2_9PLAT|nr:unnamed protein product [Protopolystoma xenopodis]
MARHVFPGTNSGFVCSRTCGPSETFDSTAIGLSDSTDHPPGYQDSLILAQNELPEMHQLQNYCECRKLDMKAASFLKPVISELKVLVRQTEFVIVEAPNSLRTDAVILKVCRQII